jgi:hypothetical protein
MGIRLAGLTKSYGLVRAVDGWLLGVGNRKAGHRFR